MDRMSLWCLMEAVDQHPVLIKEAEQALVDCPLASDDDIGRIVFSLLIMYESFERRTEEAKSMVIDQWKRSLEGWPAKLLDSAAQSWINGDKASFMPQPGELLAYCRKFEHFPVKRSRKAAAFLQFAKGLARLKAPEASGSITKLNIPPVD